MRRIDTTTTRLGFVRRTQHRRVLGVGRVERHGRDRLAALVPTEGLLAVGRVHAVPLLLVFLPLAAVHIPAGVRGNNAVPLPLSYISLELAAVGFLAFGVRALFRTLV